MHVDMPDVLFPAYRKYYASRVQVNDAMAALLVGSKLAGHTLSLTVGSNATLRQLFPSVEHIERFNMKSDLAREFLNSADHHIASVAVPYALATHEDFVMEMLATLKSEGRTLVTHGKQVRAWNMHAVLFESCGETEPDEWIQSFHALREVRNCITHAGGGVSTRLNEAIAAMGAEARSGWAGINGGMPPEAVADADGQLVLTAELVFTAFAVTKRLGREINAVLCREYEIDEWARVAVLDYASQTSKPRNSSSWRRSLVGYARKFYAAANVTEESLETAARHLGMWTLPQWS